MPWSAARWPTRHTVVGAACSCPRSSAALFGARHADGFVGKLVDIFAIIATLFGTAAALGIAAMQIGAGVSIVSGVDELTNTVLIVIILVLTVGFILSAVSGVARGIRYLSSINIVLTVGIVGVVLFLGPTLFLLNLLPSAMMEYMGSMFDMMGRSLSWGEETQAYQSAWTVYYWAWWISWSPFVGIFIARISRGRTVREFITGVLLVPTLLTTAWFVIMGGTALHREIFGEGGLVGEDGSVSTNDALFQMLDGLPGGPFLSGLAIIMIVIFFVTSSDSGSYVVDMIANGGNPDPPVWSRVMWAVLEGAIAAVLILAGAAAGVEGGGLASLQTMAIITAVPFTIVMIGICISLVKAFSAEDKERDRIERKVMARELALEAQEMDVWPDRGTAHGADTHVRR